MRADTPYRRRHGWDLALQAHVQAHLATPFRWGVHDCVLFAASAVAAMTGRDPAAHARGRYSTAAEAERYGPVAELIEALGLDELTRPWSPALGDVALVLAPTRRGRQPAAGIVVGASVRAPGTRRLERFPLRDALRLWRIPLAEDGRG